METVKKLADSLITLIESEVQKHRESIKVLNKLAEQLRSLKKKMG